VKFPELLFLVAVGVGVILTVAMCDSTTDCKATGFTSRGDIVYQCEEKK
jgi:hypothetical protein